MPGPDVTKDSEEFWRRASQGELMLRVCERCEHTFFYPRIFCPKCLSPELRWRAASGLGTVYACSVVHRAPSAAFKAETPYVIAVIELHEGPRMLSNVVGIAPERVRIGMRVRVQFERIADDIGLPRFRAIDQESS